MTNKPPVHVEIARPAARDLKQLSKSYPFDIAPDEIRRIINEYENQ